MGFLVSPGVEVKEIDLTNVIPAVSTSIGGFAGFFNWGPSNELVTVGSEKDLVQFFGTPNTSGETETSFFTAASFLKYGRSLRVSRALSGDSTNATNNGETNTAINTADELESVRADLEGVEVRVVARYAGAFGNSLKVCFINAANNTVTAIGVKQKISLPINLEDEEANATGTLALTFRPDGGTATSLPLVNVGQGDTKADIIDKIVAMLNTVTTITGAFNITSTSNAVELESKTALANSNTLSLTVAANATVGVTAAGSTTIVSGVAQGTPSAGEIPITAITALSYDPGTTDFASDLITAADKIKDEVAVVVIDAEGVFSGLRGTILEVFEGLSLAKNAKNQYNESIYWPTHLNKYSSYVYGVEYSNDDDIDADTVQTDQLAMPDAVLTLSGGFEGANNNAAPVVNALDLFADPEAVDVNFIFAHNFTDTGDYVDGPTKPIDSAIAAIVNNRKDCLGFFSAPLKIKNETSNTNRKAALLNKFNNTDVSSYLVCDSTPVYVYNKYRDTYVWIPASGHIAGLCANTDFISEPWFSPAGFTRGQIRGSVKLGYNPNQADRDDLYKLGINPIVSFPGQGIILYGDKTAQKKPSAFDRINVRRLFIILQKAISTAAKFQLFELNDEFTRFAFKNAVEPYLRDIQGRRGITDFRVVCNETNNTGEVIDTNRFVADIYIKPARSINFITLNFIATRTGIEFKEIVGE